MPTTYRLYCQTMRHHVRVRVQVPRRDGSWDTVGTETATVREWDAWRRELSEWASERRVRLVWAGPAVAWVGRKAA